MKTRNKIISLYLFAFFLTIISTNNVYAANTCTKRANNYYTYNIDVKNGVPDNINISSIFSTCKIENPKAIDSYASTTKKFITSATLPIDMHINKSKEINFGDSETVVFKYSMPKVGQVSIKFNFGKDGGSTCPSEIITINSNNNSNRIYTINQQVTKCVGFAQSSYSSATSSDESKVKAYNTGKMELYDISKINNGDSINVKVNFSHNGVNYNLTLPYKFKKSLGTTQLDDTIEDVTKELNAAQKYYEVRQSKIKEAIISKLKTKTGKSIKSSDITNWNISLTQASGFVENDSSGNFRAVKSSAEKLTATTNAKISVKLIYNGQSYEGNYIIRYTKGTKPSDDKTEPATEASKCYLNKDMEKYEYITPTAAGQGKYELYKDANGAELSSKEACLSLNEKTETTTEDVETGEEISTDNTDSGKNVCSTFKVSRERAYNCTPGINPYTGKPDGCSKLTNANRNFKDSYFQPVVAGLASYYYVYKAYYNCEGFDSTTPITSFCVDPGLQGPYTSVGSSKTYNNYNSTTVSLDKNSSFYKGLYRLYTNWYLKRETEIYPYYKGTNGDQGKEDFVDFIMDNVSRKLRIKYDKKANITYITGGTLQKEFEDYRNFDLGTGTNSAANGLVKTIWNDVSNFAEKGVISSGKAVSNDWIMPINEYSQITGDVEKDATLNGHYCRNKKDQKHPGIDFSTGGKTNVPVYAVQDGVVIAVGKNKNSDGGYYIALKIETTDGYVTARYMHLRDKPTYNVGDKVSQGDQLNYAGNTGYSSGIHLHFEVGRYDETGNKDGWIHKDSKYLISPRKYLPMDNTPYCSDNYVEPARTSGTTSSSQNSANIKITADSTVSPTKTNSGKGFTATVKFTVTGTDQTMLDSIIKDENNKIIVKTNKEEVISNESLTIEKIEEWQKTENGYAVTYKISCDNVYNYISNTDFTSVMVGLQISYVDPYSIDNILILRTGDTNGSAARLQDFVTFLNGKADKMANISISFENEQKNICRPTFAMPCTTNENVYYLIEGTQSGALYNTLINGIKGVGDLQNLLSNAYNMLSELKNFNLSNLGKNDLKIILGILENFANSGAILKTINQEISSYLTPLANNGNKTAKLLLDNLNKISFSNDATTNFTNLTSLFIKVLMSAAQNGTSTLTKDWDEILAALETGVDKKSVSNVTLTLMQNLGNAIKNSGSSLGTILQGVDVLANYFTKNFSNVTDISSAITALETTIQSIVSDGYQKLGNMMDYVKNNLLGKLDLSSLLTSPSNWNIFETISNALIVDWEKCIIGEDGVEATDPNGNSYTIQQSNDNDYGMFCTITCKEDYAIKMPGNLGTTYAGRYISTNVDSVYHATIGMAGQRVCATTEIKNDKYVETAKAKKDEMLKAYNNFYESYTKYKSLSAREKNETRSENAGITSSMDKLNVDSIKSQLISGISDAVQNTIDEFVRTVLPNDEANNVMNNFADDAASMLVKIGTMALGGSLNADNLGNLLGDYFQDKVSEYADRLKAGIESIVPNLLNNINTVTNNLLGTTVVNAAGALGKVGLEFACNEGSTLLDFFFGVGEIVRTVCGIYSGVTTTIANTIVGINEATNHKIFQIENGINYTYTYHQYVYSDSSTDTKALSSKFVESKDTVSGEATSDGNRTVIWVMQNNGRYTISDLNYGSVVFRAISQVHKVAQSLQKFGNLNILQSGNFENQINALVQTVNNLSGSISIGWLKQNGQSLDASGFSNLVTMISDIMNIFTDISGATDNVLTDVTNAVDTALLVYYDFLGIFNPYYASLGDLRHEMENYKDEYYAAQAELSDLAGRMNACTMWSNTYEFNPTIEFTYGYEKNSLLDYIVNKNDKTTDKIYLKDINKGEAENVSYYCDGDVDIKDVQNWDVITSGKCRTDDGMIGGLLTSIADDDGTLQAVLQVFKDNQAGLKKLLNNTQVKEFIQNNEYLNKISDFLCKGLGQSFCDIFGSEDDGVISTYIPGNIVYKALIGTGDDASVDTSAGIQSWQNLFKVIGGSGSLSFENAISSITNKVTYTTGVGYEVNYRNVGRVVNISRYGNPGVSVSGLSWTTILSNMATYLANKSESADATNILQKLNNGLMGLTGQGAQSFIYYKSSQQYWTSSNKGIYTKTKATADSVLVDTGDPALTDDRYKSGTDAEKQPDGLIYPIALSTKAGTYQYQIKINNVGQYYNNTTSLGRIIDDSGYVNGLLANQYVCKYEVETEPPTPNPTCKEIYESSDCKDENGYFKDLYKNQNYDKTNGIDYEAKWNACITKLLAENDSCCYLIDANNVPNASQDRYNSMCNSKCQGIKLYGSDSAIKDSSTSSGALISKNGVLQFYTKVISNYDYFPNGEGSKGFNWSGKTSGYENTDESGNPVSQDINTIINNKEEIGDGIYGDDEKYLNYSINISSACMAKIKEYNNQQELNDLGFGDYTGGIENVKTREYRSQFLKDLEESSEYAVCREKPIINQLQK